MSYDSDLMDSRRHEPCEICKTRQATEWHHCLIHRMAGVPGLDRVYNMEHLCHDCHEHANGYKHRKEFWMKQFYRYGHEFIGWWESLPLKCLNEFADERKRADESS